ncbi:DUF2778 domain-containing protein [Mesorhizobium sp. M00.F.Ca.ET.216.01.1.1]|uniref:DUF2778 domain-containing protein n=1 Tax=Mesorhizobium sp. M00.F.Ca.ET.216.01.1.1 TaxID=2500528 RepID=UPI000FD9DD49|nr:DUF2778 domain-containing protein [Mesorhizobium sp. M00.F.Ca.ET.216.01.1.1]TGQ31270.1 DUF2778 domain-containing protein [Mesorhizobium sp. M00.F.Ca.ET.216.01.1.1]
MRPGLRWVAVPVVGVAIALWSVATMAGLHSVGTSLTAASNGLPQGLLAPRTIALADPQRTLARSPLAPSLMAGSRPHQAALLLNRCDAGCQRAASSFARDGKMARLKPALHPDSVALVTSRQSRFDGVVAKAELSPQKLAAAFANASSHPFGHASGAPFMLASLPAAARFAEPVRLPDRNGPASVRFGPEVAEIERSSRLALALANALPEETVDMLSPPPSVALATADPQQEPQQAEIQMASLPQQDDMPDSAPVPNWRPQAEVDQPAEAPQVEAPKVQAPQVQVPKSQAARAKASQTQSGQTQSGQTQPGQTQSGKPADAPSAEAPQGTLSLRSASQAAMPGKPGKRPKAQAEEVLAYAKPDMPERGLGGAFKNLFNRPSLGNGVAVYDISAKTVYLPDGSRLEAHSGYGSMVDQPRYVDRKNVGPTPPNTYDLRLRESRFHGVEAIRLTPVDGKNKYGRDGLLAHTYMLRGGRAESNGCLVFKDYARFLAAYKKGKIKRLVVVPRLSKPLTRVAQEGRGA